jgi:predicted ABC-type transport system involved in lysophospholipase L1 biosynthesis ATPase subunit
VGELSGGEKTARGHRSGFDPRASCCCRRATGNLDQGSANAVASLLFELHRARNTILVVVTHNLD